jgi:small subunit ribosomal protein S1
MLKLVLEVDVENKRISLGLKQLQDNPWDKLKLNINVGQSVEGTIKAIVDFGIFVDLGEDCRCSNSRLRLSWTKKNVNPNDEFKVGDKVKGVVLTVDKETSKILSRY